jgi:hypothetical protein
VQVLFNSGAGVFTPGATAGVGQRPERMTAADLDGDTDVDLATSNRDTADASVLLNNGAGVFTAGPTLSVPGEPRGIVAADLSGDLLADLAVAEHDGQRVAVFTNLGGATFGAAAFVSLGIFGPDGITAANVDGDLDRDLLFATSANGLEWVSVLFNTGAGFAGPTSYQTLGQNTSDVVAGDFDLDGDMDVAASNSNSANVSVLLNSGAGAFGAATLFAVGTTPDRMTGGDLDGNGSMDLATANRDSNTASLLVNLNAGTVGTPFCFGIACPCGNDSASTGCVNSTGSGALLSASGSLSVAADGLVLTTTGCPPNNTGLYFMGGATFAPVFVGDGLGCTGGIFRYAGSVVSATGEFVLSNPIANALPGQIVAGDTRHFQSWTRDVLCGPPPAPCPTPCGMNSNLSNGVSVTFAP